jgi:hypothetical protein
MKSEIQIADSWRGNSLRFALGHVAEVWYA